MFAKDADGRAPDWDDFPWPVDVPYRENQQRAPRQVTVTDREADPLVPAETHGANQSASQSVSESVSESVSQTPSQSINQSTNQSTNQS